VNNNLLKTFPIALLLFFFVFPHRVISTEERKVALLPFHNIGGQVETEEVIYPLIKKAVETKGYIVIDKNMIEEYLFAEKIRESTLITNKQARGIKERFGAELILVGVIDLLVIVPENPQLGLSARLLNAGDGSILWADSAGATGDDFMFILGLGKIKTIQELSAKVVSRLFSRMPAVNEKVKVLKGKRGGISFLEGFLSGPKYFFRDKTLERNPEMKIAILPFENLSERKGAGKIITDLFLINLYKTGRFEILNPGEVQSALADLGIWHYGGISFEELAKLNRRIKCDGIILGSVEGYNEGIKKGGETFWPEVMLSARMIDSKTGRILWSCFHAKKGEDSQIVLDFGVIRSIVPLAVKTIREMLYTF